MRTLSKLSLLLKVLVLLIIFSGCKKDKIYTPVIVTLSAANITSSTATSGGSIIDNGGANIISSGVCWSTSPNPDINDSKSADGSTIGKFFSSVSGLSPLTTYHLRSYASTAAGTFYGSDISFTSGDINSTMTDIDGNIYGTVTIGSQVWMKENLKVKRYANGDPVATTELPTSDITEQLPKYQWAYNGDENLAIRYGRLYTWSAATDSRKLCPAGWHLPTDSEWTILSNYLTNNGYGFGGSGEQIAKSLAATTDWVESAFPGSPGADLSSNNSSGFEGLPGGFRQPVERHYYGLGEWCMWWSATPLDAWNAWPREIVNAQNTLVKESWWYKSTGFSVRCLKDYLDI
jgi:uncharacterized protein (TIGR02145 family)